MLHTSAFDFFHLYSLHFIHQHKDQPSQNMLYEYNRIVQHRQYPKSFNRNKSISSHILLSASTLLQNINQFQPTGRPRFCHHPHQDNRRSETVINQGFRLLKNKIRIEEFEREFRQACERACC